MSTLLIVLALVVPCCLIAEAFLGAQEEFVRRMFDEMDPKDKHKVLPFRWPERGKRAQGRT